jgi:hypothetical protein
MASPAVAIASGFHEPTSAAREMVWMPWFWLSGVLLATGCCDGGRPDLGAAPAPDPPTQVVTDLEAECHAWARDWEGRGGGQCRVAVSSPWVLAGDLSVEGLRQKYVVTIAPAWRAMAREYFDRGPTAPVTVWMFSTEAAYRRWAERLFADRDVSRFGYYKPGRRTVVVNLAEGDGPLLHELTHALIAFDFPRAPVWLEEGLAALHEASRLDDGPQGPRLLGRTNWRLQVLQPALRTGASLRSILNTTHWRRGDNAVAYAQAQGLCLYLRQQGRLPEYYRRLRADIERDPSGEQTWQAMFPDTSWPELEVRVHRWLSALSDETEAL